ncbi:MAG: UvrD-helicase domain-containing protein [Muribaculaceae bacterium]|nr:UvrD-helicase domain-containing protein [Muribaculaceae bacterium]
MPTKKFISAGAGSGKTYRITTDVAKMVADKELNPDQVIMTTFTKAAAQELREKAKNELAKLGLQREAQQMEHALIGTVHSVANTFLTKYWYLLGIMPDAAALEENELQLYRDHSLRGLLNPEDSKFLYKYAETYNITYGGNVRGSGINYGFWKADLCQVLDYIQWYGIDGTQLNKSLETTDSIIKCLEPSKGVSLNNPPQGLKTVFDQTLEAVNAARRSNKKTKQLEFLNVLNLEHITSDILKQWLDIVNDRGIDSNEAKQFKEWATEIILFPPEIAKDQREYAKLIFNLACRWQKEYRQYKDEHHLIDFNDMEEMFLRLLDMPEVQQDITSRYTHLFVDEFQDSNPMQVRIFQKLSSLLNTVYVGDKKQAIYGFRGSDTELTAAVADSIGEDDTDNLKHSYRSVKSLVDFSNAIFTQVFNKIKTEDVELKMPKENGNYTHVEHPLRLWPNRDDKTLALQIQQLILREKIASKDIAVLARRNAELDRLAIELRELNVPVCRESNDIKDSRTGRLLKALLTLVNTPYNQLARAEIAYLTEPGYNVTKIIEDRLDFLAKEGKMQSEYLEDVPILKRLFQLRSFRSNEEDEFPTNLLGYQSISALVESLVIELDLYALVQSWENAQAEETNLQVFIDLARKYEDSATKLAQPATVSGFIKFFTDQKQEGAANEDGVRLYTYHKSKGLEWKVVIMLSLGDDASDATEIATKSMLGCHHHREQLPTAENPNPPMTISLVRNIYGSSNGAKAALASRLQEHPLWDTVSEHEIGEAARLLYVGVTRARDILILAPKEKDGANSLNWFRSVGVSNITQTFDDNENQDFLGVGMPFYVERVDADNLLEWPEQSMSQVHDLTAEFSPLNSILFVSPSKAGNATHNIEPINDKEKRMYVYNKEDEEALMGDFIHQVFCCCDDGISVEQIVELRDSYGFTDKNMPEPGRLLDSWKYLTDTLEAKYGKAVKRHHEKPFRHFDAEGHIVNGYIDFIWETENAYIVVDYKTCPGDYSLVFNPVSSHYAGRHGDQLDCYQRALEAEGKKKVAARIIYYPVTRFIVEVEETI